MYDRLMSRALRTPWAILPEKLAVIADLLRFRASGGRLTAEEIQARIGDAPEQPKPSKMDGAIAVIPVFGVISHRANSFDAMSGGTSTELLGKYIRKAVNDDSVKSILLDISSPGGEVSGVPELAAEIAAAAKVKTVVASSNALAASAAYWLGSQASEFVVTPSGQVGSIGVYLLAEDLSEHLAKEGIKITPISAGRNKLEGAWWEPMSDETRDFLQAQVDDVYAQFVRAVASGRGVTQTRVEDAFGQGRVFHAKEAQKLGMVDAIETQEETIARLMRKAPKGSRSRMSAESGDVTFNASDVATMTATMTASAGAITVNVEGSLIHQEELQDVIADAVANAARTRRSSASELEAAADPAAQIAADQDYTETAIKIAELL